MILPMKINDSNPRPGTSGLGVDSTKHLIISIRRDQSVVNEAAAGMERALRCLQAGLDDIFLHEMQEVIRVYIDSERGRLFALAAEQESNADRPEGMGH